MSVNCPDRTMPDKPEINDKPDAIEKPAQPKDTAITKREDQAKILELQAQAKDSPDTPSGIMKRLTGQESVKLAMIDSADSPSMEAMQALSDPKALQELELRRGIRQTMEPGPERDEAERITKEVMRAKEVVPPVEITVEKGDNLWKIARSHIGQGASNQQIAHHVENIVKLNSIKNPDLIYPGQRFRLPGYTVEGQIFDQKQDEPPTPEKEEVTELKTDIRSEPVKPKEESTSELTDKEMFERIASGELEKDPHDEQRKELLLLSTIKEVDTIKLAEGMQILENRLKSGSISQNELLETYKQVGRLVDGEGSTLLSQTERNALAVQVMKQAGDPHSIDQGRHNTCTVTALESRIYTRHPDSAAKLVADIALQGQFTDTEGYKVELNPKSSDPESKSSPEFDGNRSHASELFQVAAVNLFWARENKATGKQVKYEQRTPGKDTGEYLMDYSETPPKEVAREPYMHDEGVQLINKYLTGEESDGIMIAQKDKIYGSGDRLTTFSNEEEFQSKLVKLHEEGKFPVLLAVFSSNCPWWSDSGGGEAGGSADNLRSRHVVSIADLKMGPPISLKIDNQWGSKRDHQEGARILLSHDLYAGTIEPVDSLKVLENDTAANRKDGTVDAFKEFELVRLKRSLKAYGSDEEFGKAVHTTIRSELSKWNEQKDKGIDDNWRRSEELRMVQDLINSTDAKTRMLVQFDVNQLGFMSDEVFDSKLTDYATEASARPPEEKKAHLENFRNILRQLPSDRANRIIDEFEASTETVSLE